MRVGTYHLSLLDPILFWRKVGLLVLFFGLFVPLKLYRERLLVWYALFLIALHVYILFVFLYRVRWRVLANDRRSFAVRLLAIGVFIALLMIVKAGATAAELALFVLVSGAIHVALLLSLTLRVDALEALPATDA